ncbi:DNA phosphorothioation-associated protein 4 [Leptodesmis sp.]|uniref:DNA phosphorothioation-associated protein 4 n=1 Tax=Leptodesmis sp. TaxID=3100501 RepID=UPI004053560B
MKGRIRVARDKAEFIRALKNSETPSAPFQTYADIVTFAAVIGIKRRKREPLEKISMKDPDPIPQEQFFTRGYESIINLLAILNIRDLKVLSSTDEYENLRLRIFEEYANAGFRILRDELSGSDDYTKQLLLILKKAKLDDKNEDENIDLNLFF